MTPLLQVQGIDVYYGQSQALYQLDLTIMPGQVAALMGRNGMGKSTTIRAICGMSKPAAGSIHIEGVNTAKLASHKVAQLGVGLVPEGRRCFSQLSVAENLQVVARTPKHSDGHWDQSQVERLFPRLAERRGQNASTLSGGEQQMLAIGRALMTNPKLLILDEATEGLAPVIRQEIWAAIKALKAGGMSLLVIDKTLKELLPIADHCIILQKGTNVFQGLGSDISAQQQAEYLGV